jgi:hypothetical protein
MNISKTTAIASLIMACFAFALAVASICLTIRKIQLKKTPAITHDTVYVPINTDTLYDNAVRVYVIDSNCYSTYFEKIKDSVVNFR